MNDTCTSHRGDEIVPVPRSSSSAPELKQRIHPKPSSPLDNPRTLQIGQADIAWERLKRVVRDHCHQYGFKPLSYQIGGNMIEFSCAEDGPVVTLVREDGTILLCMNGAEEVIRIVRLKTNGVGFEYRSHRYTATRTIVEIVREGRQMALKTNEQNERTRPATRRKRAPSARS